MLALDHEILNKESQDKTRESVMQITQDANRFQHRGRMPGGEALGSLHMAQGAHGAGQTGRRQAGTSGVRDVEVISLEDS